MATDDEELMQRIQRRDAGAFEVLLQRYERAMGRHLAGIVRDDHASEDLVQEVFLRVWTRADQWDARGTFKAWLFRIATNLALNHLRAVRRRKQEPLVVPADPSEDDEESLVPGWLIDAAASDPQELVEQSERRKVLGRLLSILPDEKRQVVQLVYEEEMDISEVAAELRIPEGTVKSRLHYALKHLTQESGKNMSEWEVLL